MRLLLRWRAAAGALIGFLMLAGPVMAGCGTAPGLCQVAGGSYALELPAASGGSGGIPAVLFLHGYGASGDGTMRNRGMVETLLARGYAVIAPDALQRPGGRGRAWAFHPDFPGPRDEMAFIRAVADDAAAEFGIDRARILLGGFSIGGSMVSYIACNDPSAFAAYAPVAGSFWRPHPERCRAAVKLLHTHGWTDVTVPLEGRSVGGGSRTQGDVFRAMEIWRATNGCTRMAPEAFDETDGFWLRRWTSCAPGSALEFALHQGAHGIPRGWATLTLDWFERVHPAS